MIYQPEHVDAAMITALWQRIFGAAWPLTPELAQRALIDGDGAQPRELLLAEVEGEPVGLAVVEHDPGALAGVRRGCLVALGVAPEARRRGVGATLHEAALGRLRASGVGTAQLGGGSPRLWPGAPHSLPGAVEFFAAQGWVSSEECVDMLQHLEGYVAPQGLAERAAALGIGVGVARPEQVDAVLAFVAHEFPEWIREYRYVVALGDVEDLVVAEASGDIIGALVLYGPWSHPARPDTPWQALLGADLGGPGVVGVAHARHGQGIGSVLVARANELLRERGVGQSLVGWTSEVRFYARLGYRVWQRYAMSWRDLGGQGA